MRVGGKGGHKSPQELAIGLIRTAMIEKKINQAELADAADCHEKTVQNLLGGKAVRQQTLFDVCMVLGLDYDEVRDNWHGSVARSTVSAAEDGEAPRQKGQTAAPVYMGAYTREYTEPDSYSGTDNCPVTVVVRDSSICLEGSKLSLNVPCKLSVGSSSPRIRSTFQRADCSVYSAATTAGASWVAMLITSGRCLGNAWLGALGSTNCEGGWPTKRSNVARLPLRLALASSIAETAAARLASAWATSVRVTSPTRN